ncbi:MAG TPA: SPFH domain-containing protein, partial [Streptomyces sp.]|nr:SPFH domain-containing protein [Streptomyces sp.]
GEKGAELFSEADMASARARLEEVSDRITGREEEINALLETERPTVPAAADGEVADAAATGKPAGEATAMAASEEAAE